MAQGGWHYELEDAAEPLSYKGVVFNEMKGVYSSPDSLMYRAAQEKELMDRVQQNNAMHKLEQEEARARAFSMSSSPWQT